MPAPPCAAGWWGAARFASAGCLEGLDKAAAEAQRRRVTFDEDTQARIFTAAHASKTQGKVGLGQGTGTVKVGGVKWEGKRVSFEEGEGQGEAGEEAAPASGARLEAIGSCTHLDALAHGAEGGKQRGGERRQGEAAAVAAGEWEGAVKWRKLITAQLQAVERQQLSFKELQRRVLAAVMAKHGSLVSSKAAVKAAFRSRLEGSSKFVVEGKLVCLRS